MRLLQLTRSSEAKVGDRTEIKRLHNQLSRCIKAIPTHLGMHPQNNTVHAPAQICIQALRQLCIAGLEEIPGASALGIPGVSPLYSAELSFFANTLEQLSQIQFGNVLASFAAYRAASGM
jgi:hypothetical protein